MNRYKQNLKVSGLEIYSYNTLVAKIDHFMEYVVLVPWCIGGRTSSPTTSKHINYVAKELGYIVVENDYVENREKEVA